MVKKQSVQEIVKPLSGMVDKLKQLAASERTTACKHEAAADKLQQQAVLARHEADRADNAAAKIEGLLA